MNVAEYKVQYWPPNVVKEKYTVAENAHTQLKNKHLKIVLNAVLE